MKTRTLLRPAAAFALAALLCPSFGRAATPCAHPDSSAWEPVFDAALSNAEMKPGSWKYDAAGWLVPVTGDTLFSKKDYGPCIVDCVYVMAPTANSGLFLYDTEHPRKKFEVQILDDRNPKYRDEKPYQLSGSIYGRAACTVCNSNPPGQENRLTVWCAGKRIRIALNGLVVCETDLDAFTNGDVNPDGTAVPTWHKGFPPLATIPTHGRIGLQGVHGSEAAVRFKYLRVKPLPEGRTYYVDAEKGRDDASGLSPAEAWRTTARVNKTAYGPGDRVLFRAGQMWRGHVLRIRARGRVEQPVVLSRYGEGEDPAFYGSLDGTRPGFWTAAGDGLWTTPVSGKTDVGNIVCILKDDPAGKPVCGWKRWKKEDLKKPGDYYHDLKAGLVWLKCARDPAETHRFMEVCLKGCLLRIDGTQGLVVERLRFLYTGGYGITGAPVQHLRIRNCTFGWVGGQLLGMWPDGRGGKQPVRSGNGIEFWTTGESRDIRIENNFFYEVYDTAMTNQGDTPGLLEDMVICSNRTLRCEQSYEIWFRNTNFLAKSIHVFGNRFEDSGYGWSHAQRPDKNATHFLSYGFTCRVGEIFYHDNYLGRSKQCMFWWFCYPTVNHVKLDRNTYVQPGADAATTRGLFHWRGAKEDFTPTWEDYRRLTGNDAHSTLVTPPASELADTPSGW